MSLGLFNWTSNLSDEPEYPPFFDNLKISVSGRTSPRVMRNEECIIWIDGGGEFDSTEIGSIEYVANDLRFGQQFTPEKIPDGVYLVLEHFFMNSWSRAYTDENFWNNYIPAVKEKFEKDSDAWHLATTGFTPKQIRDNFVFSDVEERYVCINPEWNAKAVEILTAQSPSLMRNFNKCINDKELLISIMRVH
tara:strand:+ start:500 stop:1075 length:576 start_codon:yes stop_codon:yes gene_type:complete